jgi:hypothetical protein
MKRRRKKMSNHYSVRFTAEVQIAVDSNNNNISVCTITYSTAVMAASARKALSIANNEMDTYIEINCIAIVLTHIDIMPIDKRE